ncbi:metallophosphoesterase [Marinobacterium arenosum]|uniref:metallophosphoesterase n=1 Tax=Marinobacterium arenosum TaxID=2862496 RepID=UPI001C9453DE|nr:metallophosphoesterase [Marinobacterium arenosum]MBY4678821.1 metallophosphoesterase [Marinobacterium arenosum]
MCYRLPLPYLLLLPLLSLLLGGCSTFRDSFHDILNDSRIERVVAQDPVARLRLKQRLVRVGDRIELDGGVSRSNRGRPLSYRWSLQQRPAGSEAELSGIGERARLTIDRPGLYRVRLVVNDGTFDSYPFDALLSTEPGDLDRVRFIATGDTGTGGNLQYRVAEAMERVCAERGCDFLIGMGDNIYQSGPKSLTDPQFLNKFERPYQDLSMPFFMVIGNHDASGLFGGDGGFNARGGIEVEYTRRSDKWAMPQRYYRIAAPLHGAEVRLRPALNPQPLVEFYALDSTPLTSLPDRVPQYRIGLYRDNEGRWLDAAMNNSKAQWRIAFAHHPYLSNGVHGNAGNYDGIRDSRFAQLLGELFPSLKEDLLQRAAGEYFRQFYERHLCGKVDLYMAGHDHNMQWLAPVERCGKTEYIVSGAGAKANALKDESRNQAYWQQSRAIGFFWIEIVADRLQATIYTVDRDSGALSRAYDRTLIHQGF